MNLKKLTQKINEASSLADLVCEGLLPEPNDDGSYFFFYYSRSDFKSALKDIVTLSELGLSIWYDRKQENGASWYLDMLQRASNFHCASIVFYLSENAVRSDFFWQLCALVVERHLVYCSVNLPDEDGNAFSIHKIAKSYSFTPEQMALATQLFGEEITYIPYSLSVEEKKLALERTGKNNLLLYTVEGDAATVLCVKDLAEEEIVIPPYTTISDVEYPVRSIAPRAFANCRRLKKLIIPDSVEYIGEFMDNGAVGTNVGEAFFACFSLEELKMPANLKVLRTNNFDYCTSLKRLYIGDKVEQIVEANFTLDELELDELCLPPIVKRTQEGKFLYFDEKWKILSVGEVEHVFGYEDLELPETYIAKKGDSIGALYQESTVLRQFDASNLDEVLFDAQLWQCENLEKVILPQNARYINSSFWGCTNLTDVVLPDSLEEIGPMTFSECNIPKLVIPQNVRKIDKSAFSGATIHTLISDSKYNDRIFAPGNQYNQMLEQLEMRGRKRFSKFLFTLFLPILMFFTLVKAIFLGNFVSIILLLTFPVSFWLMMFGGGGTITQGAEITELYLRCGTYKKRPKGWKRACSNIDGYDCFVRAV